MSAGPGSAGNVIAAIASFVLAGLGQLAQGRAGAGCGFFLGSALVSVVLGAIWAPLGLASLLAWGVAAAANAAAWDPEAPARRNEPVVGPAAGERAGLGFPILAAIAGVILSIIGAFCGG